MSEAIIYGEKSTVVQPCHVIRKCVYLGMEANDIRSSRIDSGSVLWNTMVSLILDIVIYAHN